MRRESPQWWKSTLLTLSVGLTLGGAMWLALQEPPQEMGQTLVYDHHHHSYRVGARTRAS